MTFGGLRTGYFGPRSRAFQPSQRSPKRPRTHGETPMIRGIHCVPVLLVLALLLSASCTAQQPFVDSEKDHWAFAAMDNLQKKGILVGYPDGHFRGKRTMTRYEFAA